MLCYLEKKFHLFLRSIFKGFRKAAQMKTIPWLPNWSTWWLLKKKNTHSCRSKCHPAELWAADTGLSPRGSAVSGKALLMSHVSRCLHYGSVRVCSANKNTDTPTNFTGLKNSWEKSGVGTKEEESTVPIAPAAGSACARGSAAFCHNLWGMWGLTFLTNFVFTGMSDTIFSCLRIQ